VAHVQEEVRVVSELRVHKCKLLALRLNHLSDDRLEFTKLSLRAGHTHLHHLHLLNVLALASGVLVLLRGLALLRRNQFERG
jgi:hypothetical protein